MATVDLGNLPSKKPLRHGIVVSIYPIAPLCDEISESRDSKDEKPIQTPLIPISYRASSTHRAQRYRKPHLTLFPSRQLVRAAKQRVKWTSENIPHRSIGSSKKVVNPTKLEALCPSGCTNPQSLSRSGTHDTYLQNRQRGGRWWECHVRRGLMHAVQTSLVPTLSSRLDREDSPAQGNSFWLDRRLSMAQSNPHGDPQVWPLPSLSIRREIVDASTSLAKTSQPPPQHAPATAAG